MKGSKVSSGKKERFFLCQPHCGLNCLDQLWGWDLRVRPWQAVSLHGIDTAVMGQGVLAQAFTAHMGLLPQAAQGMDLLQMTLLLTHRGENCLLLWHQYPNPTGTVCLSQGHPPLALPSSTGYVYQSCYMGL